MRVGRAALKSCGRGSRCNRSWSRSLGWVGGWEAEVGRWRTGFAELCG